MDRDKGWKDGMDRADVLLEVVRDLAEANASTAILVEGPRDELCLRKLGCGGEILRLYAGSSVFNRCERIAQTHPSIILLMDWDRKGRELREKVGATLEGEGVAVDLEFSKRLLLACGRKISEVEEVASYFFKYATPENLSGLEEIKAAYQDAVGGPGTE